MALLRYTIVQLHIERDAIANCVFVASVRELTDIILIHTEQAYIVVSGTQ